MPDVHYVKFLRGSSEAWEQLLLTPNKIDDDTLYFIYENSENTKEGRLFLGQKLISGIGGDNTVININDLENVDLYNLIDKQLLVYNDTTQKWVNASLSEIINTEISDFSGATINTGGSRGLVPAPAAGDQDKFLRGDKTWAPVPAPTFDADVFDTSTNVIKVQGFQNATIGSIPIKTSNGLEWSSVGVGVLNRQITTLEKLQAQLEGTDPEPLDTNTIYMVPNGNSSNSSDRYNEYMIIGNALEMLGTFGQVDLVNYVTTTTFNTRVGSLENLLLDSTDNQGQLIPGLVSRVTTIENNYVSKAEIGDLNTLLLSDGNSNLVEEVNTINERLKWQNLIEN